MPGNTIGLTAVSGGGALAWYSGLGLDGYDDIAAVSTFTAMAFRDHAVTLVGLAALAIHPAAVASFLPLSSGVRLQGHRRDPIGGAAALGVVSRRQLKIGRFADRAVAIGMVVDAIADQPWRHRAFGADALPAAAGGAPTFLTFLPIFAAATAAGVLSHVPAASACSRRSFAALPVSAPIDQIARRCCFTG